MCLAVVTRPCEHLRSDTNFAQAACAVRNIALTIAILDAILRRKMLAGHSAFSPSSCLFSMFLLRLSINIGKSATQTIAMRIWRVDNALMVCGLISVQRMPRR